MSVNAHVVPPWKQALLEKKRRQEEVNKRVLDTDEHRLSQMPAWKRDIILKKQQQKNSMVFMSKPRIGDTKLYDNSDVKPNVNKTSNMSNEGNSTNYEATDNEVDSVMDCDEVQPHIIPITHNPLLRKDPKTLDKVIRTHKHYSYPGANTDYDGVGHIGHSCSSEPDGSVQRNSANCDDVFIQEEEEVTYGRGFVHKLLQRFSHLSTKDESDKIQTLPRRANSTENILDDKLSHRGYSSYLRESLSPSRTRSSESLSSGHQSQHPPSPRNNDSADNSFTQDNQSVYSDNAMPNHYNEDVLSVDSKNSESETCDLKHNSSLEDVVEELPRPNTVRSKRNVFENILNIGSTGSDAPKKRQAPEVPKEPRADKSVSNNGNGVGKYYNDTLSRKSGHHIKVRDDEQLNGKVLENGHDVTDNQDSGPILDNTIQSIQSAGKSWYFSSSRSSANESTNDSNSVKSPPPKHSVVYPAVTSEKISKPSFPSKPQVISPKPNLNPYFQSDECTSAKVCQSTTEDKDHLVESKLSSPEPKVPSPEPVFEVKLRNGNNNLKNGSTAENGRDKGIAPPPPSYLPSNYTKEEKVHVEEEPVSLPVSDLKTKSKPERPNLNLNLNQLHQNEINNDKDTVTNIKNLKNQLKKTKRPAPSGPGSMLIRPASNLVATGTKTEYLNLTKYNDVKVGSFAPAKKRPSYYDGYDSDDEDIPVTNIDDVLGDDVPITNIDDVTGMKSDANDNIVKKKKKYEFVGANVKLEKNLLEKTRNSKKMKLTFAESLTSTFEYPSEQFLIDTLPPEEGDLDYNKGINRHKHMRTDSNSSDDSEAGTGVEPQANLLSTPGIGSMVGGSLSSYKSKLAVEYEFGVEPHPQVDTVVVSRADDPRQQQLPSPTENVSIKPADEDFNWSDAQSADMLF